MAGYLGNAIHRRLDPDAPQLVAEIGVDRGQTSGWLLARLPLLTLIMIDQWKEYRDSVQPDATRDQDACNRAKRMAYAITNFAAHRRKVIELSSDMALQYVPKGGLDMAFIDANHMYECVKADLYNYLPKVKSGGWLCGHDWEPKEPRKYGVNRAVEEFAKEMGLTFELDEDATWFFRKP